MVREIDQLFPVNITNDDADFQSDVQEQRFGAFFEIEQVAGTDRFRIPSLAGVIPTPEIGCGPGDDVYIKVFHGVRYEYGVRYEGCNKNRSVIVKSMPKDEFELPLPAKRRVEEDQSHDDPLLNGELVMSPKVALRDNVKSAWIAHAALKLANEEANMVGIYAELMNAGDVDRAIFVHRAIMSIRNLQLDMMGVPTRPKGDLKRQGGDKTVRAAIPSE